MQKKRPDKGRASACPSAPRNLSLAGKWEPALRREQGTRHGRGGLSAPPTDAALRSRTRLPSKSCSEKQHKAPGVPCSSEATTPTATARPVWGPAGLVRACQENPPSEPPGVRSRTPTLHGQRHTHGWGRLPSSGELLRGQVPEPSDPKPPCPTGPVKLPIYAPNQALSGKLVKNKHRKLPVCTDCRGRADEPPDSHLLHPNALHTRAHELPTAD